jgi:hypothetical protein
MEMQLIAAKWQELQKKCSQEKFQVAVDDPDTVGENLWKSAGEDGKGKHNYKMYDLTEDPCPSHPPLRKSSCNLK